MQQSSIAEPPLPADISADDLDAEARRDLRGLQKDTADTVARHLVAAGRLVDDDPQLALLHARFARRRASRIAVVREAAGIAAYHAGEWNEALGELRAARRMGGGPGHLAVMADIERALGRPERALELARGPEIRELSRADAIELTIVVAGARRDLGELDASVVALQIPELDEHRRDPWSARLFYAYADNLLAAGRESDALQWFVHAVDADVEGETDADRRIADLTGEPLPDDGIEFGEEELELPGDVDVDEADEEIGESESAAAGLDLDLVADKSGSGAGAEDADPDAEDPAVHLVGDSTDADPIDDDRVSAAAERSGADQADTSDGDAPAEPAPATEITAAEIDIAEIDVAEMTSAEKCAAEITTAESSAPEITIAEGRAAEITSAEDGAAEITGPEITRGDEGAEDQGALGEGAVNAGAVNADAEDADAEDADAEDADAQEGDADGSPADLPATHTVGDGPDR